MGHFREYSYVYELKVYFSNSEPLQFIRTTILHPEEGVGVRLKYTIQPSPNRVTNPRTDTQTYVHTYLLIFFPTDLSAETGTVLPGCRHNNLPTHLPPYLPTSLLTGFKHLTFSIAYVIPTFRRSSSKSVVSSKSTEHYT